jgi:predicted amidohydrolase YtcJ
MKKVSALFIAGFILLLGGCFQSDETADLILHNAKVLTVDANFSVAEAVAIKGDRILAVGSNDDILNHAGSSTRKVDMAGKTLMPGLIDNHAHIMRSSKQWRNTLRLDGVTSRATALQMISDKAKELGEGEWVINDGGFSPTQFRDNDSPLTLQELDKAAPNNPVLLQHLFSMAFVNSKAFLEIGIDEDTDIAWLEIANDIDIDQDDKPTGVVRSAALRRMQAKFNDYGFEQHTKHALKLNQDLNALGLTSVIDATGGQLGTPEIDVYSRLDKENNLTLRVFHLLPAPAYEPGETEQFKDFLKGVAFLNDSDYFQRIGVGERLYTPVHDSISQPAADSDEHKNAFKSLARQTAEAGLHLHQHTTHIKSINQLLDAYDEIAKDIDISKLRWAFTHVDGIDKQAIERAKKHGMMLAAQSRRLIGGSKFKHFLSLIDFGNPPVKDLNDSGIKWGLGTDTMTVAQMNPFNTLWWAITGKALNGEQLTDQMVDRKEALIAHTRDNAWFMLRENDLGSIEKNKFADLLVLEEDYMKIDVDQIKNIKPLATIVGGKVVSGSL